LSKWIQLSPEQRDLIERDDDDYNNGRANVVEAAKPVFSGSFLTGKQEDIPMADATPVEVEPVEQPSNLDERDEHGNFKWK
jgi:hypothetical protein